MTNPDSGLTKFLAVWGAILSSITFGWSLYRDLRDRAKIKISAELRRIGRREGDGALFTCAPDVPIQGASEKLFVVVSVVNVGRRPMRWKGLGGQYRHAENGRKGFQVSARHLPRTLQEQEQHDEAFDSSHHSTKSLRTAESSASTFGMWREDTGACHDAI